MIWGKLQYWLETSSYTSICIIITWKSGIFSGCYYVVAITVRKLGLYFWYYASMLKNTHWFGTMNRKKNQLPNRKNWKKKLHVLIFVSSRLLTSVIMNSEFDLRICTYEPSLIGNWKTMWESDGIFVIFRIWGKFIGTRRQTEGSPTKCMSELFSHMGIKTCDFRKLHHRNFASWNKIFLQILLFF